MTSIKHSIRYFAVAADGTRTPSTKGLKSELWAATCAPCSWDTEAGVAHAKIVELVAGHKDVAAAAAPAPVVEAEPAGVTKAAAKKVGLPVGSATALLAYANDAGNWGGNPWVNGNVNFGKSTGGYIGKLVAAGMITLGGGEDGEETFIIFTPAGVEAALALGASDSIKLYA